MPEPADRPPSLRERLAKALRKAAYVCPGDGCPHDEDECGENEPIVMAAAAVIDGIPEAMYIDGEVTAIADAVMPVVEAETAALRERAEQAERERDQARDAIADERRGRLTAEAAVRRARALHQPTKGVGYDCDEDDTPGSYGDIAQVCTSCGTADEYGVRWPCPTIAALDAEQPKEETP